jgi:predicted phage terminase large subunit-like protein
LTAQLGNAETIAIGNVTREELSRRTLLDFAERMIPDFHPGRHLRYVADLLESVERGELDRLIVTLFPGSGKSTLLQCFGSWYLGRNPRRKVIVASASAELAERNSRGSRALFTEDDWPFHAVELSKDVTAMTRWSTSQGGTLAAFGVGSQITGWRADLLILDDLQNDALTPAEREKLWKWYVEVLLQRLNPNGAIVLIQQRWGEDDLCGRAMAAPDGSDWRVVRLPALAEENDPLGRVVGESLWPEVWPAEVLERRRRANERVFECAYQGNPMPGQGNLIKPEWLQRYDAAPKEFTKIVCALDAAAKTGVRNDYSAIVKLGVTENSYYVLDVWRDRVEFPALVRRVKQLENEDPEPSAIYVEDTSNAVALIQQLRQETTLPIVPVSPKGSKESRVEGITGTLEAKRLFLPNEAPWLLEFERELLSFPLARHDDMVDALTLAVSQAMRKASSFYFSEVSAEGSVRASVPQSGWTSYLGRVWPRGERG